MFSPCCSHDAHRVHTDLFFPLPAVLRIRLLDMDSNRKKIAFKWRQTAVTSPAHLQGRDTGSVTPSRRNSWPNEDSNTLPPSDCPGPCGLGSLSLDTPKRKAEVLGKSMPSYGKVKLRKLSRKNHKNIITSQVNLYFKSLTIV